MTDKTYHLVPNASPPPPSSRYSHAVEVNGWLYVTGQLPANPDDPAAPLAEGIQGQSEMCFENLRRILHHAGYLLSDTVFVLIYLAAFDCDFAGFKQVYASHFPQDAPLPGRTTVGVAALGRGRWSKSIWFASKIKPRRPIFGERRTFSQARRCSLRLNPGESFNSKPCEG